MGGVTGHRAGELGSEAACRAGSGLSRLACLSCFINY